MKAVEDCGWIDGDGPTDAKLNAIYLQSKMFWENGNKAYCRLSANNQQHRRLVVYCGTTR
jgi:hypothetical protein